MVRLEWLLLMEVPMGVLMFIFLRKQIQMKKQLDHIVEEVLNYITYVTEQSDEIEEKREEKKEKIFFEGEKRVNKKNDVDAQNRLIQAILKEYFP
ncbi:MAG: hypothetical protein IKJ16_07105 [Agathobacter sp.]|nr:hypothetical protein [Agathobacter sp.]